MSKFGTLWLFAPLLCACAAKNPAPAGPVAPSVPRSAMVAKDDPAALQLSCDRGAARDCVMLGAMFAVGRGVAADQVKARQRLERGCALHDTEGCVALATMLYEGKHLDQDERGALAIYQRLCDDRLAIGCTLAGIVHSSGRGVALDRARANTLFERACADGDRLGCMLQTLNVGDEKTSPPSTRTLEHAEALCDLSNGFACGYLGAAYLAGNGVAKDASKARSFLGRGCDHGSSLACVTLGVALYTGDVLSKDDVAARRFLDIACTGKQGSACTVLGLANLQRELGFTEDPVRAIDYFEKGCAARDHDACSALAMGLFRGEGVPKNVTRAVAILDENCHDGFADACAKRGAIAYEAGDKARAKTAFLRACTLGLALGCDAMKKLNLEPTP